MSQGFGLRGVLPAPPRPKPWDERYARAALRKRKLTPASKRDPAPFGRIGRLAWIGTLFGIAATLVVGIALLAMSRVWQQVGFIQGIEEITSGQRDPGVLVHDLLWQSPLPFCGVALLVMATLGLQFVRRLCDARLSPRLAIVLYVASMALALGLGFLPYGAFLTILVVVILFVWAALMPSVDPS